MPVAKQGDTVQVHYTGKLEDGTVFDASWERGPVQFTIGRGQVIAGFEQAILGMNTGESKTTKIPVGLAYGPRRDDMVVTMKRSQLPPGMDPQLGQRLEITQTDNKVLLVTVTSIEDSTLTIDANHPLAGKELIFDFELVKIV
jgi:FKBP-type peptidyl-prolyl cis-trans isomerase 2